VAKDLRVKARLEADVSQLRSELAKAETSLSKFNDEAKETEDQSGETGGALDNLGKKFTIVAGSVGFVVSAFKKMKELFDVVAEAASLQEVAITRLDTALERAGAGASGFSEALQGQALELQNLGLESDKAIISVQALLLQLGVAPSQIMEATQASLDLSAALGINLESAAQNVGQTVSGFAGELGSRVVPELENLSKSALEAGDGIRLLSEEFEGSALKAASDYAAGVNAVVLAQEQLSINFGKGITEAEGVGEVLSVQAAAYRTLAAEVGFTDVIIGHLNRGLENLETVLVVGAIKAQRFGNAIFGIDKEVKELTEDEKNLEISIAASNRRMEEREAAAAAAAAGTKDFLADVKELGVALEGDLNKQMEENIDLLERSDLAYRQQIISREDFENIERAIIDTNEELNDTFKAQSDNLEETGSAFNSGTTAVGGYQGGLVDLQGEIDNTIAANDRLTASLNSVPSSSFGGAIAVGTGSALAPSIFTPTRSQLDDGRNPSTGGTRTRTSA